MNALINKDAKNKTFAFDISSDFSRDARDVADGKTVINDIEHVLRGYEDIENKLKNVGAKIKIVEK